MLDPNGIIVSWNLGAQRIKGYSAEEAIGKHFSIVYTREDCARGKPAYALGTAASEGRYEDEGLRVRKDGTNFWANVIITPMRDKMGNLVGYSKVTRDVTERRQTDIALRAAMQSAQAAAQAKQSFLAVMSHEIRTPLHAVITLSFLLQTSELNPIQRDYLETIHNSSKQLLGIINDILDFTKIVCANSASPLLFYELIALKTLKILLIKINWVN
jgi:osomolarity two-component system sensor histidine kinase TcsA